MKKFAILYFTLAIACFVLSGIFFHKGSIPNALDAIIAALTLIIWGLVMLLGSKGE